MKFLSCEKLSEHKYKTPEGYLVCVDSILARTGKQTYKRKEVFGIDCKDAENEIEIDRPANEVFSDKTLASFENKPLTVEHPDEDVNISNHKDLAVGFARDIKRGKVGNDDVMLGTLVITDADAISGIENGEHTDLSCGYDCDIVDEDNPCQRNIRGNHIALCQQGRAGIARIVDSVKDNHYQIDMSDKDGYTHSLVVKALSEIDAKTKASKFKPDWKYKATYQVSERDIIWAKNRGLYIDGIKDANDLPEDEDSEFLFRDAYGKEIFVTNWDGKNQFMVVYEGREQLMNRRDVEQYLDKKGAKFSRVLRDSVKDAKEYVFNWRDTYHGSKEKTRVDANNIKEAIKQFYNIIALGGIGTANCYVISISPNDGYMRAYGKLSDLVKEFKDSVKDAGVKLFQVKQGYAIVAKKYYNQYKDNAFVDRTESSLESARYTKMSLERNDNMDFIIIDCTQANVRKIVDALVEPSKEILDMFENQLKNWKINIDNKGKTWSGRIHYQVSSMLSWEDFKTALHSIEKYIELKGVPMTFSANTNGKTCTAGIDLDKMYVKDSNTYKEVTNALKKNAEKDVDDAIRSGLYKFEVQITAAPPYTPYIMYVYAADVQEVRDKVKLSNPKYGIGRIIKREKISDSLKTFKIKHNNIVHTIKTTSLINAISNIKEK